MDIKTARKALAHFEAWLADLSPADEAYNQVADSVRIMKGWIARLEG